MAGHYTVPRQLRGNWCWAAVTSSLHKYFSTTRPTKTQEEIVAEVLGGPCAADPLQGDECDQPFSLTTALERTRFRPGARSRSADTPFPLAEIKNWIDGGGPVAVRIQWRSEDPTLNLGHFVVISGYGKSEDGHWSVLVCDPEQELSTVLPVERFAFDYREKGAWSHVYFLSALAVNS